MANLPVSAQFPFYPFPSRNRMSGRSPYKRNQCCVARFWDAQEMTSPSLFPKAFASIGCANLSTDQRSSISGEAKSSRVPITSGEFHSKIGNRALRPKRFLGASIRNALRRCQGGANLINLMEQPRQHLLMQALRFLADPEKLHRDETPTCADDVERRKRKVQDNFKALDCQTVLRRFYIEFIDGDLWPFHWTFA